MAVTLTNLKRLNVGNGWRIVGTITGPASYTTGGETISAAQITSLVGPGRTLADVIRFDCEVEPAFFRTYVLDRTNAKMLAAAGAGQVASTTNLSAVSINFEALIEVSNG